MIQIAIVEDNRLVREGLTLKLNGQEGFAVTYAGATGDLDALREGAPHVLLLDAGLEGEDSLELADRRPWIMRINMMMAATKRKLPTRPQGG